MPDLTIQTHRYCTSLDESVFSVPGSRGQTYTVTYARHRHARNPDAHGWDCTCPDYTIRRAHKHEMCKHIRKVKQEHFCGWFSFTDPGDPVGPDKLCPKCKRPTNVMQMGV